MAQFVFFVSLFKIKLINVRLFLSKWHLLTIYIRHWVIHRSLNPYNKWMKSVMLISSLRSWEIWGALRLNKLTRLTPWGRRSDSQPQQAVAQLWVLRMRMSQKMSYRFQSTAHHSSQAVSKLTCEATVTNLHSTEKKTSSQRGESDHGKGNRDLTWELDLLLMCGLLLVFQIRRPSRDQNSFSRVVYFPMN